MTTPIPFSDIHSHIIYGADDGAQSMTEAIRMLQADRDQGAAAVFATPHYGIENGYAPDAAGVMRAFERIKERAAEEAEIKDRRSDANESRTPARDDLKRIIPGRCVAFYEASMTETGNRISKKAGK